MSEISAIACRNRTHCSRQCDPTSEGGTCYAQQGFSLLELLIVLAIAMVISAAAYPTFTRTMQVMQLRSSAEAVGGLLQRARMLAVRDNRFYSVIYAPISSGSLQVLCIDLNWNQSCDAGEPIVELANNVSLVTTGFPSTTMITCGSAANTVTCPSGYSGGLNFAAQAQTVVPSYNARGLPCVGNPVTPPPIWPSARCFQTDSSGNPVGFVRVFRYATGNTNSYAALSITPAGLVTVWVYNPSSGGTWAQQ
jgi:prepilin-type N-terminal cleavage/methylation domain-containing protein